MERCFVGSVDLLHLVQIAVEAFVAHGFMVLPGHRLHRHLQDPEQFFEHASKKSISINKDQSGQAMRDKKTRKGSHCHRFRGDLFSQTDATGEACHAVNGGQDLPAAIFLGNVSRRPDVQENNIERDVTGERMQLHLVLVRGVVSEPAVCASPNGHVDVT